MAHLEDLGISCTALLNAATFGCSQEAHQCGLFHPSQRNGEWELITVDVTTVTELKITNSGKLRIRLPEQWQRKPP
jgi:hypothetical protein